MALRWRGSSTLGVPIRKGIGDPEEERERSKGRKKRAENADKHRENKVTSSSASSSASSSPSTERKGIVIGKEEKEILPPTPQGDVSESSEDFYDDNMPTENANAMLELEKRVRSLRSGWELPLAYSEQRQLAAASRCLSALTATDWQTLKDYLFATIPQGVPAWQPRNRSKFLENPADVWTYASTWKRKQDAKRPPPNTIPMPVMKREIIPREELAEVFANFGEKKKM